MAEGNGAPRRSNRLRVRMLARGGGVVLSNSHPRIFGCSQCRVESSHTVPPAFCVIRAAFFNAFSMLNEAGEEATVHSLRQYRGNFSPQFYPRRYILKDDLYEQDLYILQILLKWELKKYAKAGVTYVEFSVSARDLIRPWVYNHLTLCSNPWDSVDNDLDNHGQQQWRNVRFCFLAGFSRAMVSAGHVQGSPGQDTWLHQAMLCDDVCLQQRQFLQDCYFDCTETVAILKVIKFCMWWDSMYSESK